MVVDGETVEDGLILAVRTLPATDIIDGISEVSRDNWNPDIALETFFSNIYILG